ncbi:META domain-containing protein [Streptomyces sp. NPDC060194]|uniref:META domain-containing protein n=1 Tax=Streptomyces sp. NPDC060194 TaxID=3347069 RepID=UPI003652CC6D
MYTQRATLTALGLLALTACGTQSGDGVRTGESDTPLTGVTWAVDDMTVDGKRSAAPSAAPDDRAPRISFDGKGGAEGSYGCNGFSAEVTIKDDVLTLTPGMSTQMDCGGAVQAFENRLREALTGKLTAGIDGNRLTLTREGVELTLTEREAPGSATDAPTDTPTGTPAQPADPSRPGAPTGTATPTDPAAPVAPGEPDPNGATLFDTRWKVTSLAPGPAVKGIPKGVRAPGLTFSDGRVQGDFGCNGGSATVKTADPEAAVGTLTFGPLTTTKKLCDEERMATERSVMDALSGTAEYRIEDGVLTVTNSDGKGLVAAVD